MALAPAKLNLWLDVLGRRPDGYHALETLFVALEAGDDLEVDARPEPGVTLALEAPPDVPRAGENLATRAAEAWLEAAGASAPSPGLALTLVKRIPVGGGLGGGSSDAGTVLARLVARWPEAVPAGRVEAIARTLGADVPFFASGARAGVGRGRGDEIEALPAAPPLHVVLVTPPWGHATAQVFAHASAARPRPPELTLARALAARAAGRPDEVRAAHWNALALPAMRAYPAFTRFTSDVERRLGRPPCLSGSGSTLFDVADDEADAREQARRLAGLRAVVTRTR